ncbi:MAG: MarR family winged helix-turn-helix transcriptional regulator [Thermoanaerobaculia bacterium]
MTGHLQKELKQQKPFGSVEQEVVLNVMRTAGAFRKGIAEVLRPFDLSAPQYNILRILRGATEADGIPCSEISDRLVSRDPDVTRLLDRLEKRALVARVRSSTDRRVVNARITKKGQDLVNDLDVPMANVHAGQLSHMKRKNLRALVDLLEEARGDNE